LSTTSDEDFWWEWSDEDLGSFQLQFNLQISFKRKEPRLGKSVRTRSQWPSLRSQSWKHQQQTQKECKIQTAPTESVKLADPKSPSFNLQNFK